MAMTDVTVRPAEPDDAAAVARLWWQMARAHEGYDAELWTCSEDAPAAFEAAFAEELDAEGALHLVATDAGGEVVGYMAGGVRETTPLFSTKPVGRAFVRTIVVDQARRRQGIASALLASALAEFRRRGAEEFTLSVAVRNPAALALYHKVGLRDVATLLYRRL